MSSLKTVNIDIILRKANLSLVVGETRYGSGYTAFIGTGESLSVIEDAITGGDSLYQKTELLHRLEFPINYGNSIEDALNNLDNMVYRLIEKYGSEEYCIFIHNLCNVIVSSNGIYSLEEYMNFNYLLDW